MRQLLSVNERDTELLSAHTIFPFHYKGNLAKVVLMLKLMELDERALGLVTGGKELLLV